MNFDELKFEVQRGVVRDDMNYGVLVNEAIYRICDDRDWTFMRNKVNVTLLGTQGDVTVNMPDGFKKLCPERVPIVQIQSDGNAAPCEIYTREALERIYSSFGALITATGGRDRRLSIFVDVEDNQWVIGIPAPAASDIVFRVSYFAFFAPLANPHDHNILTDNHARMVIERAKMIAFGSINDPEEDAAYARYKNYFDAASRTDLSVEIAARKKRG